jgi:Secretion system C-terminal sorting domain
MILTPALTGNLLNNIRKQYICKLPTNKNMSTLYNPLKLKQTITLLFALFTIIKTSNAQNFLQKGSDIDGEAAFDYSGKSVSMPDNNTMAVGAYENDNGNGIDAGQVRIFEWIVNAWAQKGSDIDGEAAYDISGNSVSMPDSNTVAIGAPYNDGNGSFAGHVRIYHWNSSAWVQKGSDIDGEAADDRSGWSVSMPDSNTVAIGAIFNNGNGNNDAGHVRIYSWNGSAWVQKGSDINGEALGDNSGWSVSMPDSNTVAIGAHLNDGNGNFAGHVRIYSWNGSVWVQKGIDIDAESADDRSGWSVSMPDSNNVAIGAIENDNGNGAGAGHVRIYRWNGGSWVQKGVDIDGEAADDQSGTSISMPDSNTVAIGASENNGNGSNAGHVRIYQWNGNAWVQKGNDIDGETSDDWLGTSVSMPDSNTVGIGAYRNSGNGINSGHTRVYSTVNNVGVLENNFGNTLTIFPNPTNGEMNIDLGTNYNDITVIITNQLGQDILKKNYSSSNLLQLNIPGEAGVYFIEVRSGDKKAIVKVMKE